MPRVPQSTYRLQLHAGFTFEDAIKIVPYLKSLGVSHVYCSPYLQAAPGSMHGYDVVDHQCINSELGGEQAHQRFCARLAELGLGQVLDIVPNHMAIGPQNKYWWDVLENGPSSRFATWFDIDWHSSEVRLQNKVLIPVLGDQYGKTLADGQIKIERDSEALRVRYAENIYPLAPRSLPIILERAGKAVNSPTLGFFADSLSRLPLPDATDVEGMQIRHRDKEVIFGLLHRFCDEHPKASAAIDQVIAELNANCDELDELLNQQHYRLAYWRTADQELGYRRFFDINTLVGVRIERPHVFNATHRRILEWLNNGVLDGVRVDHPDGLRDPLQYFTRLRERASDAWIIGEKILEPGEFLRSDWPIEGTSGYDFLNVCNGLFMQPEGLRELTEIYRDYTQEPTDFSAIAHDKKLTVEQEALGSDVNRLADLFLRICENNRDRRDYTRAEIRRALRETAACFHVYRSYVVPDRDEITDEDRREVLQAVECAKQKRNDIDNGLFDFMAEVLLLRTRGQLEAEFVYRFQQFTSPVMAKGVEDTAFYCYNRMVGLNEVGSAPGHDGLSLAQFHDYCGTMQSSRPSTMTTLSTHDTKRSDDVRARLAVLTEMPGEWRRFLRRWMRQNAQLKTNGFPDRNTEYFLYQTMIGAWPIEPDRLHAYMEKAVREAKQHTTWTQQNKEFEDALHAFIDRLYEDAEFLAALEEIVRTIITPGRVNSLTQTLLNCVGPGVPDTYQGSELWALHLVDPDNRRPVDYETRAAMLAEIESGIAIEQVVQRMDSGLPKLWVLHRALNLRTKRPDLFGPAAEYTPLMAAGRKAENVVAFLRAGRIAAIAPRWNLKLANNWSGTSVHLPNGRWKNLFTGDLLNGGITPMQILLQRFPVALLQLEEA
ncbi:malto-oligosyltrehalose synthase [Occallatibacter savannae]|uniref:malto-oligosyltrehalose synthase n=1 Tax=Occallatibacter savannae TaxID=1002691 RepID=UPI000D69F9F3|nr:malto-oligosyltrehalose synthase [Occallatibacter savannae]